MIHYMYFSKQKRDFLHDQMGNNCHIKRKFTLQAFIYYMYIYITEFRKRKTNNWLINDWGDH